MDAKQNIKAEDWVNELLSQGKYAFTLDAIRIAFPNQKNVAIKSSLKRLVDKPASITTELLQMVGIWFPESGGENLFLLSCQEKEMKDSAMQML